MPSVFSMDTLMPLGLVISIATFSFLLGKHASKITDHGERIDELEKKEAAKATLNTDIAVLKSKMESLEIVVNEMRSDLKRMLTQPQS
jgi:hypothetical protein